MTSGVYSIPLISTDGSGQESEAGLANAEGPRHFLVGPENPLLGILTQAVSAQPPLFNPITLYGPTGVGKSHLLNGTLERHRSFSDTRRAVFLTGADFARGLARAIELDSVAEWREKNRIADIFVLDDLQELANKPAAQQELTHTIDAFADQGRQMLLASRHAPLDWNWMAPALRSRIEGGLTIPIAMPGIETQQQMAQELARRLALPLDGEIPLVPNKLPRTFRQIQHAVLNSVQQRTTPSASSSKPPTASRKSPQDSLQQIAKLVARQSQVKLADLLGPSRRQKIVQARGIAIYLARTLLQLSFDDLGDFFGGRDHTTVLHSWRTTTERLDADVRFKHEVQKLVVVLGNNFEIQSR